MGIVIEGGKKTGRIVGTDRTHNSDGTKKDSASSGGGLSSKNQKTLDALKKGGANQQIEGTENYAVSGKKIVPRFRSTSPVLSSNDLEAQFGKDSEKITGLANAGQNVLDTGVLQDEKAKAMAGNKEQTPGTDEYAEGIDKYYQGAKKQNEDWKKQATADVDNLFNQSRAAYDSQYRASVQSISSTYARLIETQSKINQQVVDRTKAYGASGGNALYTPMEFTDAVAIKEREAANEIAGLETERNAKIAQALADRDEGRALSLSQKLKDIREIDDTIYSRMADIEKEVQRREKLQLEAWKDLQDQQKQRAMEVLELYKGKYLQDFRDAETFEDKQKIIERIAAETGGAVSPGQIFSAFGAAATDALKAEREDEKFKLDVEDKKSAMKKRESDTAIAWRNSNISAQREARLAKTGEKENVFADINTLLDMTDEDGTPFTDEQGYFTKEGFKRLVAEAKASGVSRKEFLEEYGDMLYEENIDAYGLTAADKKVLGLE